MKLPGTVPPNVQNVYMTPSEMGRSSSRTSRFTINLAGVFRLIGGGTFGAEVSIAMIGSPTGGPRSPAADPPVSDSALYENRPKVRNKIKPMVADDVMLRFFIDVGPFDFCEAMEMLDIGKSLSTIRS